jgi:hypothetical protein
MPESRTFVIGGEVGRGTFELADSHLWCAKFGLLYLYCRRIQGKNDRYQVRKLGAPHSVEAYLLLSALFGF